MAFSIIPSIPSPLYTIHTLYPQLRSKEDSLKLEIRQHTTEEENKDGKNENQWFRVKAIQQYRGSTQRKMKLELFSINAPIQTVFWHCKSMVQVRIQQEPSTENDTVQRTKEAEEDLYELEEYCEPIHTAQTAHQDNAMAESLTLRQILDSKPNPQNTFTLLMLERFQYDDLLWNKSSSIEKQLDQTLSSADVHSIAELLYTFAKTSPCFLLPSELFTEPWLIPHSAATTTTTNSYHVWVGISYEEAIKWMQKFVLTMIDVFFASQVDNEMMNTCGRANIQAAFANNGDLIMHCFRARMEYDETSNQDKIKSKFYLNPWSSSSTMSFRNGVMQIVDKTTTRFIPFKGHPHLQKAVVQCSDQVIATNCNNNNNNNKEIHFMAWWTTSSFLDKENAAFAIRVLASCLFREEHRYPSEHRKVVIIFEHCSPSFAFHLQRILIDLFAKYILRPESSDVPFGLHTFFRFAITNLCQNQCVNLDPQSNQRYDVASNLGASIPHIVLCPRDAIKDVNFSGHAAPYIFNMKKTRMVSQIVQTQHVTDVHSQIMLQKLMQVWQKEIRSSCAINLADSIPVSIQNRRMEIVQLFAAAVRFMSDSIIYNEYNGGGRSISYLEIKVAFGNHLNELIERNELTSVGKDRTEMYRDVVVDHLARSVPDLKDPWCNVHLRKVNENKPIYHRPICHEASQVFEKMYNTHLQELFEKNKPTKSRTQFFFWCRASTT